MTDFLKKKNHKAGLTPDRATLPHQLGSELPLPQIGVKNTAKETTSNTQAPMNRQIPQGKPHAKVMGASQNLKHGKYL